MNTRYLEEFLLFAKMLNYTVAAKKLYITRPTLSEHIAELEEELGCKLVTKNQGKALLTPAGKRFVQTATNLMEEWDEVCQEYLHLADNLLTVTVASTNLPWIETILYKARRTMQESHPNIHIDIVTVNGPLSTVDALGEQTGDIVVAGHKSYLPEEDLLSFVPKGAQGFKLDTEEIKLIMTQENPLFDKRELRASDLNGATIVLPPDIYQGYLRDRVIDRFAEKGARISLRTADFNDHFEYFTYDFGSAFGIVPTTLMPRFGISEREECRAFTLPDLVLTSDFYAVFREGFVQTPNGQLLFETMEKLTRQNTD